VASRLEQQSRTVVPNPIMDTKAAAAAAEPTADPSTKRNTKKDNRTPSTRSKIT
jgi:hypothetical protein